MIFLPLLPILMISYTSLAQEKAVDIWAQILQLRSESAQRTNTPAYPLNLFIFWFSYSGYSKTIAKKVQQALTNLKGSFQIHMEEIQLQNPYPQREQKIRMHLKKETESPKLIIPNKEESWHAFLKPADLIILIGPIWNGKPAPPIVACLLQIRLLAKTCPVYLVLNHQYPKPKKTEDLAMELRQMLKKTYQTSPKINLFLTKNQDQPRINKIIQNIIEAIQRHIPLSHPRI